MKILKNIKKNTIVLCIITFIVLFILLKDDFDNIVSILFRMDIKYILLALLFYLLSISIKGLVNYLIVHNKNKLSIREAIKHNVITQFFNGVTPFASGGQPMEIYMLTEHDISLAKATNYTLQSFVLYQVALVICGLIAVIYNLYSDLFTTNYFLRECVLLGFVINIIVVIFLIFISFSKKSVVIAKKIFKRVNKLFHNRFDEEKIFKVLDDFYQTERELKKNKKLVILGILLNIVSLVCFYVTPLFVVSGLHETTNLTFIHTITASAYVYIIGSCVPIPGGTGGIEYGFTQFFGMLIPNSQLQASLISWRFITYYFGIIIGAILFDFEKKVER